MAEYALIIGGIAIVVIAGILILGPADPRPLPGDGQLGRDLPGLVSKLTATARRSAGHSCRQHRP